MYISKQDIKAKRKAIRKRFPVTKGWKWSVTAMDDNIGVTVALMQYPEGYTFPAQQVIEHKATGNHCHLLGFGEAETNALMAVSDILVHPLEEDKFYVQLGIGGWDVHASRAA